MDKIRVLLAEDHTIVRKGLRSLLDAEPDIEVVGEADNGRQAIQQVRDLSPDVVLMDITMPELNGLEATRRIKGQFPQVQVLVLSMHANEQYVFEILRAGASGYLVKQSAVAELVLAIRAVHRGDGFLSPAISRTVIDEYSRRAEATMSDTQYDRLTPREREVLQLVAEGHSNREIADALCISIKTVEAHRAHLMDKLDLHNTAELTRYAIAKGLISTD
jgi:DNA-binding NarL/FixJ family response regulator